MQQLLVPGAMAEVEVQMPIKCVHIVERLDTLWICVIGSMASFYTSNSEMDLLHTMFFKKKMQM